MRRSHLRLESPNLVKCSRCSAMKERHTVCANCGYYRGKQVAEVEGV